MNFDDLKEQLRERLSATWSSIQESPAWIQIEERFQNLSPNAQKAVWAAIGFLSTVILLAIPWSFFSSSQEILSEFEDKRELVRETYRVSREKDMLPPSPSDFPDISGTIRSRLENSRLAPEQITDVMELGPAGNISGIPKSLKKNNIEVTLAKLNLRQVIDIGQQLQSIQPSIKLSGLQVRANAENNHYFDVVYKLVAISIESEPSPADKPKRR